MNQREKTLLTIIGMMVGLFVVAFGARSMFVKPIKEADRKVRGARQKLEGLKKQQREYFSNEDYVKTFTTRTFSHDLDEASAKSGEVLTKTILQAGLSETEFSRLPVGPIRYRGAREIGWSVRGDGPQKDVFDLLFLLQNAPAAHRLESLTLSKADKFGLVRVSFRYMTLVVEPAPLVDPINLSTNLSLTSAERKLYDPTIVRDILRPYIKRPPAPPPAPSKSKPTEPPPLAPPGPETFKVVSLSQWAGTSEIHVRDLTQNKTLRYTPGDELAGGKIVLVDYRPMPMPGNPGLRSHSRVILKIGEAYWAIERGQTLAQKHQLKTDQLPSGLAKL
ncbi:MAG: hypothetical protein CMO80_19440 [Verrucomicrobiales bacterium]|nr:hypothetical protein [Verrucomicrobiales bacterium]